MDFLQSFPASLYFELPVPWRPVLLLALLAGACDFFLRTAVPVLLFIDHLVATVLRRVGVAPRGLYLALGDAVEGLGRIRPYLLAAAMITILLAAAAILLIPLFGSQGAKLQLMEVIRQWRHLENSLLAGLRSWLDWR